MKKLEVGIIGGGISGLTAANELIQQLGTNVCITIFEKESQLGGRIFTRKFNDCSIELGAQFYVDNGIIQQMVKSLGLESDVIPLDKNFISFYFDKNIYSRENLSSISIFNTDKGKQEKEKLYQYAKKVDTIKDLTTLTFKEWYHKNIGEYLLPFWNRMLISIGIRDANSINAYFGLTLVNVFLGKNYLLKDGMQKLVDKLSEKILFFGGKIILNANCKVLEKNGNKFRIKFEKQGVKKEKQFNKIISAVKPKDLTNICNFDNLRLLQKVDGHPMALYVIRSNRKLWSKTWGLIISEESSPIYALCDWKNINQTIEDKLFLAICSPNASEDEIINGLRNLFLKINSQYEIIFEKKWEIGLHQPNPDFFKIREEVLKKIPKDFYLAGDWMILPALEGAVLSGTKAARQLIKEL